MATDSDRPQLPFEPKTTQKTAKAPKTTKKTLPKMPAKSKQAPASGAKVAGTGLPATERAMVGRDRIETIPDVVSRRMIRRMAVFSGVPTALAMVIFVGSYFLLTRHVLEFPKVVVLLSTLGCFGLGVVGLSYGVLSASWDESVVGSPLGMAEFSINFKRMIQALRSAKSRDLQS